MAKEKKTREILDRREKIHLNGRVLLPLTSLQSFNAASIVLSYLDYDVEVMSLLSKLSHNSLIYSFAHSDILNGILPTLPKIERHRLSDELGVIYDSNELVDF